VYRKAWIARNPDRWLEIKRIKEQRRNARIRSAGGRGVSLGDWRLVLSKQMGTCRWCGFIGRLEMDHVIAICEGGKHELENVVGACKPCNLARGLEVRWRRARAAEKESKA
jgi:5-methylcytosine-specific restriction endonuclease McrA